MFRHSLKGQWEVNQVDYHWLFFVSRMLNLLCVFITSCDFIWGQMRATLSALTLALWWDALAITCLLRTRLLPALGVGLHACLRRQDWNPGLVWLCHWGLAENLSFAFFVTSCLPCFWGLKLVRHVIIFIYSFLLWVLALLVLLALWVRVVVRLFIDH